MGRKESNQTNKTNKDHESVPANAHLVEIATVVQIQMILKKKQDVLDFDL